VDWATLGGRILQAAAAAGAIHQFERVRMIRGEAAPEALPASERVTDTVLGGRQAGGAG
jgi:hypothetical protein